jgi:hypothetical protein
MANVDVFYVQHRAVLCLPQGRKGGAGIIIVILSLVLLINLVVYANLEMRVGACYLPIKHQCFLYYA